ncbi:hypothetical protein FB451DRAFT_1191813 [Mycena latifolia]|nr:hypothetical protein FB451DRAFT_1191813 [Mycena latifolia]
MEWWHNEHRAQKWVTYGGHPGPGGYPGDEDRFRTKNRLALEKRHAAQLQTSSLEWTVFDLILGRGWPTGLVEGQLAEVGRGYLGQVGRAPPSASGIPGAVEAKVVCRWAV